MNCQKEMNNRFEMTNEVRDEKQNWNLLIIFSVMLIFLIAASFTLGRYQITIGDVVKAIRHSIFGGESGLTPTVEAIVIKIRFPRIIAAVLIGAALAVSGGAYQGTFRNPMVSPDILGASAGASFGATLGILLSLPGYGIQILSFMFGLLAVVLTYTISKCMGQRESTTLVLVLSGMVISTLFSAFISMTKYLADPYSKLPEITFWLMGGLSTITLGDLKLAIIPIAVSTTLLMLVRWRLNVLAFGDEEAAALGINTKQLRLMVIVCATMLTASVVSISGQVGWVGLIIPHLSRMIVGPNYKYLLPAAFLVGSIYLLLVDNIARNLFEVEIPIGILTAIIGAPFFIYLLLKGKKGWI